MPVEEPDVNRRYFVHYVRSVAAPGARVLDYGCGHGTLVELLLEAGFDAWGCDVRWPGADYADLDSADPGGGRLRYFESGGRLPYEDDSFDVVVSDQVFEHVPPLEASVRELERVVKPDGVTYHHIPLLEVVREPHSGLPLSHRMRPGRARHAYATTLRRLGVGKFKDERPAGEWARHTLQWIDDWTEFRPAREIYACFGANATITHHEIDYARFRAREGGQLWLERLLGRPGLAGPAEWIFRRLAFDAFEARPARPD